MLYGSWLNRCTRVKPVLRTQKPLSNIVEANITRETGGSKEQFIGEAPFGSPCGAFLSSQFTRSGWVPRKENLWRPMNSKLHMKKQKSFLSKIKICSLSLTQILTNIFFKAESLK